MVAGLVAIPFTAGISAILTGVGTAVSVVGGVTAGGACITESVIRRQKLEKLQALNKRLYGLAPSLEEARSNLHLVLLETLREFQYLQPNKVAILGGSGRLFTVVGRSAHVLLKTGARAAIGFTDELIAGVGKGGLIGVRSGTIVSNATKIAIGSIAVALTAALDAYTIVASTKNMINGNRDEAINKLVEAADVIRRVRKETKRLLDQAEKIRKGNASGIKDLMEDALTCAICFEVRQPIRCEQCQGWVGCMDCIVKWLSEREQSCPICRKPWERNVKSGGFVLNGVDGCEEILILLNEPIDSIIQ